MKLCKDVQKRCRHLDQVGFVEQDAGELRKCNQEGGEKRTASPANGGDILGFGGTLQHFDDRTGLIEGLGSQVEFEHGALLGMFAPPVAYVHAKHLLEGGLPG